MGISRFSLLVNFDMKNEVLLKSYNDKLETELNFLNATFNSLNFEIRMNPKGYSYSGIYPDNRQQNVFWAKVFIHHIKKSVAQGCKMKYTGHLPKPLRNIEDFLDNQRLPFDWREAMICWPLALILIIYLLIGAIQ